ncbi:MAG TPA: Ppx/GppA phosphatase family protein [Acidimicrobiales bacterium]|nr:Ppx/GppA phosphatase family protein [Acidimicrobiales bacterium]
MRIAAFDLGSNSFHLLVADAHPDGTFEPVATDKEMLRLGSAVAATGEIGRVGAASAVSVVRRFRAMAESQSCDEIVACATAAFREATDSLSVVDRIEAEAGVKVRVISGREEAQLIFDAVRASVAIDRGSALALDLGGGSLEVMVGDGRGLDWATSLKLGVARLTAEHVRSDPLSTGDIRRVTSTVAKAIQRVLPEIQRRKPRLAIGSSGTLETLIRLAATRRSGTAPATVNQLTVRAREIEALGAWLLEMTSAERASLPGVDARRADLLPTGALLLSTVLDITSVDDIVGCEWALREGMVLDAIGHHSRAEWDPDPKTMRRESVLALCRRYHWNEPHSEKVARLAVELFDGMSVLHDLSAADRELLEMGALLHDIGEHVSKDGHERHTAYLIENGRLRGFSPAEIDVLTCLGRFHKRGTPKSSFEAFARLKESKQKRVTQMIALLQIADGLDRSHGGPVRDVHVYANRDVVEVVVEADDDIDLELWGLRRKRDLFERVFDCRLDVVDAQLELVLDADNQVTRISARN